MSIREAPHVFLSFFSPIYGKKSLGKEVERGEKGEKEKEKRKSFWGCVGGVVTLLKAHSHPCVVCMGPEWGRPGKGSPITHPTMPLPRLSRPAQAIE